MVLKCGGSVFVSSFDSRIALGTVLHELLQNWPADRRKDYDGGGNLTDRAKQSEDLEISEIEIVGLPSLLLRRDHIKPDREKREMFDDLDGAQNNATCNAKCNELSDSANSQKINARSRSWRSKSRSLRSLKAISI
jgi:hypothetical protein